MDGTNQQDTTKKTTRNLAGYIVDTNEDGSGVLTLPPSKDEKNNIVPGRKTPLTPDTDVAIPVGDGTKLNCKLEKDGTFTMLSNNMRAEMAANGNFTAYVSEGDKSIIHRGNVHGVKFSEAKKQLEQNNVIVDEKPYQTNPDGSKLYKATRKNDTDELPPEVSVIAVDAAGNAVDMVTPKEIYVQTGDARFDKPNSDREAGELQRASTAATDATNAAGFANIARQKEDEDAEREAIEREGDTQEAARQDQMEDARREQEQAAREQEAQQEQEAERLNQELAESQEREAEQQRQQEREKSEAEQKANAEHEAAELKSDVEEAARQDQLEEKREQEAQQQRQQEEQAREAEQKSNAEHEAAELESDVNEADKQDKTEDARREQEQAAREEEAQHKQEADMLNQELAESQAHEQESQKSEGNKAKANDVPAAGSGGPSESKGAATSGGQGAGEKDSNSQNGSNGTNSRGIGAGTLTNRGAGANNGAGTGNSTGDGSHGSSSTGKAGKGAAGTGTPSTNGTLSIKSGDAVTIKQPTRAPVIQPERVIKGKELAASLAALVDRDVDVDHKGKKRRNDLTEGFMKLSSEFGITIKLSGKAHGHEGDYFATTETSYAAVTAVLDAVEKNEKTGGKLSADDITKIQSKLNEAGATLRTAGDEGHISNRSQLMNRIKALESKEIKLN